MEHRNEELDILFAQYREALSDANPSAGFMPNLWRAIDAKRSFALRIKRVAQVILTGAAFACLAMVVTSTLPSHESHATYTDVLAASHRPESLASLGIVRDPAELGK